MRRFGVAPFARAFPRNENASRTRISRHALLNGRRLLLVAGRRDREGAATGDRFRLVQRPRQQLVIHRQPAVAADPGAVARDPLGDGRSVPRLEARLSPAIDAPVRLRPAVINPDGSDSDPADRRPARADTRVSRRVSRAAGSRAGRPITTVDSFPRGCPRATLRSGTPVRTDRREVGSGNDVTTATTTTTAAVTLFVL